MGELANMPRQWYWFYFKWSKTLELMLPDQELTQILLRATENDVAKGFTTITAINFSIPQITNQSIIDNFRQVLLSRCA